MDKKLNIGSLIIVGILVGVFLHFLFMTERGGEHTQISLQDKNEEVFTIGFIPAERADEFTPKAEALAIFLEEKMGMPVEVVVPSEYEPLIEGLRFGHIDAAYMDAGPAWIAHHKAGAEVVLAEVKKGNTYYYGELFRRSESSLRSLEDVVGKKIAFTSYTGSSGFVFPIGSMIRDGLITLEGDDFAYLERALNETFALHMVSGGYQQSLSLLLDGTVDVVGGAHDAPERFLEEEDRDKVKSFVRLGKVPSHPVVVASHVSEAQTAAFVEAMLQLNEEEYNAILQELYGVDGLAEVETQAHLRDFGPAFEALSGIHEDIL